MSTTFTGITCFDFNWALKSFGGSVSVSSNTEKSWLPFTGDKENRWISSGENTDGDSVSIERDLSVSRSFDSIITYNTNILNITFEYYDGTWHNITDGVNAVITKSIDNKHIYILMNSNTTASKIRISGSNTIVADQEKYIYLVYMFEKIGKFTYPIDPNPIDEPSQKVHEKDNAKKEVIVKGVTWKFNLKFSSHVLQADIDLYTTLKNRNKEFYLWINGGNEAQFEFKFEPYRFQDIYLVQKDGAGSPQLTNNFYWTGLNDSIRLVEGG